MAAANSTDFLSFAIREQQQSPATSSSSGPGRAILEIAIVVSIVAIVGIIARAAILGHCRIDKRCTKCLEGDVEAPTPPPPPAPAAVAQAHALEAIATTSSHVQQPPQPNSSLPAVTTPAPPPPTTAAAGPPPTRPPPAAPPITTRPPLPPLYVVPTPPYGYTAGLGASHILPAAAYAPQPAVFPYPVAYYSNCQCHHCCREE